MDFMKVFDQTVREIKREVNLKVLKVPEIEQKVLDATDDEPWGPHGTVLAEIAQATKKYTECQMIMNVLWTRLAETGKNWRLVYKALSVIEYLVANGSERAVDDIVEHTYQISSLGSFEYVEPSGKDVGLNVRKKAETIAALLNDKDKIQQARDKAAATREKYVGLSSSGITYKSGAASFSGSNFKSSDRYGGFGNKGDSIAFSGSYKNQYGDDKYVKTTKSKKETSRYDRKNQDSPKVGASKTSSKTSKMDKSASISSQDAPSSKYDDDFDDFDPRGTSSSKPSGGSNQVDLLGQNFVDLFDAPLPPPTDNSTSSVNNSSGVDLFAKSSEVDLFANSSDVDLFSKSSEVDLFANSSEPKCGTSTVPQTSVDLFASQPASTVDFFAAPDPVSQPASTVDFFAAPDPVSQPASTVDFFAAPDPVSQPDNEASKTNTTSSTFDPFAAVPMNNFDGSMADSTQRVSGQNSPKDQSDEKINGSSIEMKTPPKNETFQVKSGIWADSLSRGLIDLNITAPTKVNLADIGIVGGLTDGLEEKDKGYLAAFPGNLAMGIGSGAGKYGSVSRSTSAPVKIDDDDFFSSLSMQHHQPGGFQK